MLLQLLRDECNLPTRNSEEPISLTFDSIGLPDVVSKIEVAKHLEYAKSFQDTTLFASLKGIIYNS